jgi:hypothetical protein
MHIFRPLIRAAVWVGFMFAFISPAISFGCNYRQLEEDLRWCLIDAGANQDARAEIVAGAYNKDSSRLDSGFNQCQAHSSTARDNYNSCSPGARIDTARAILGWALLIDTPNLKPLRDQLNREYKARQNKTGK